VSEREAGVQHARWLEKRGINGRGREETRQYGKRKRQTNTQRGFAISYNLIEMYYLRGL